MKKTVLFFIAACLLLSGCSVIRETGELGEDVPVSTVFASSDEQPYRIQKGAVYFYNESSDTLTAEILDLIIRQDENPARAAIELLLGGPSEESGLAAVAPEGMKLGFIEFSRNVSNIYLNYNGSQMEPLQKYTLELAITNTVTDILDAEYVCIFYNGVQTGFSGAAAAPFVKHTGSVNEAYGRAYAKYIGTAEPEPVDEDEQTVQDGQDSEQNVDGQEAPAETPAVVVKTSEMQYVLYFVSDEGGFILPEVRSITYTGEDYIEAVIQELIVGPADNLAMKSLLPAGFELLSPPVITDDRITLSLNKLPTTDDFADEDYEASYAALVYTVTSLLPGIVNIDITVLGQPITDFDSAEKLADGMQRLDYYGYIGSSAPIYFNDKDSDLLLSVKRSMEQASTWSPEQRVFEILRGPLSSDTASAWPVMPSGITYDDILSVKTFEDTVYVDLSENFREACQGMSGRNEMLLVYSIVNTLTSMDGVNKVQFLIEGQQAEELAGTLCIADPFIKNYDIIK